jgi:uncharacterized Zn finger protein
MWWNFRPYVSVAKRRANALRETKKLAKKGQKISPVQVDGRTIATTFWGKAWCDHLESYSDFSNRLPRGRTYVRNGSVVDLQIEPGKITSMVSGSDLYRIAITIKPLPNKCWGTIRGQCGGQIGSMVELLQGKLSKSVMEIVTRRPGGMFPTPAEIEMSCSCPDYAGMCKHLAATLYGVGNRLDHQPDLLFKLRKVDHLELIASAGAPLATPKLAGSATLSEDQLADVFGIELASLPPADSAEQLTSTDGSRAGATPAPSRRRKRASAPLPGHAQATRKRSIKVVPEAISPATPPTQSKKKKRAAGRAKQVGRRT